MFIRNYLFQILYLRAIFQEFRLINGRNALLVGNPILFKSKRFVFENYLE